MPEFAKLLHLPWGDKLPKPVSPPKPEPLVGKAAELWRVFHPKREPDIKRSVIFGFDYRLKDQQVEKKPGEKIFDRIMQANIPPEIDRDKPPLVAALSLNPEYLVYSAWLFSGTPPPIPQDFESPISFKLSVWGCRPTKEEGRPLVMDIIEIPQWRPELLILGRGTTPDSRKELFDMAGLEQGDIPIWQTARTHVEEGNLDWKRKFISDVLGSFIEQYQRNLAVRGTRRQLSAFNLAYRRKFAEGLIEIGSIASAIHNRNALFLSLL